MSNEITVADAAVELAAAGRPVSERRVRKLCEEGRIEGARKVGRDWLIPRPVRVRPGTRGPKVVPLRLPEG